MSLAEKIAMLRRRHGWSQEDLAERLGVSRQSVSKYEGAQSVHDLNGIVRMSEIFGVSTDYLLKDDGDGNGDFSSDTEKVVGEIVITREMADEFLLIRERTVKLRALAMMLFVWSPAFFIFFHSFGCRNPYHVFNEDYASMTGLVVLLLMVAVGISLNSYCSFKEKEYDFLKREPCHSSFAVSEMIRQKREEAGNTAVRMNVASIVMFFAAPVPLLVSSLRDTDFMENLAVSLLLMVVGAGVFLRSFSSGTVETLDMLAGLKHAEKEEDDDGDVGFRHVYWGIVFSVCLVYSWISGNWEEGGLIFIIAWGVRPAFSALCSYFANR